MLKLPIDFIHSINQILPSMVAGDLIGAIQEPPKVSIRLNASKGINPNLFLDDILGSPISHCPDGFLLNARPLFTADPAFHAGAYYVQEANSMIIGELVKRIINNYDDGAVILDLCASPGGKSTHVASHLRPGDLLVANEVISSRCNTLIENLCKWGQGNHIVTSADAKQIGEIHGLFQIIIADMPCSGEGMFRKTPDAIEEWSLSNVELCTDRQKRIAHDIWPSLAEGGVMIYSTCTYNRCENEDNVNYIANELGANIIEYDFPDSLGIFEIEPGKYRMMPSQTQGEGFFFAILQKTSKTRLKLPKVARIKPSKNLPDFLRGNYFGYELQDGLMVVKNGKWNDYYFNLPALLPGIKQTGVNAGQLNKNQWKTHPEYDLLAKKPVNYPLYNLTLDEALQYYKREFLSIRSDKKGITGLRWNSISLGTANAVNTGFNNLWPMNWRILQGKIQANSVLAESPITI
ncbi:MAG: RNA methyltransferase [Bacteroidia bacterium]